MQQDRFRAPSSVPLTLIVPLTDTEPVELGHDPVGVPPPPPPVVGVVPPPPEPSLTSCHCWLAPSRFVYPSSLAPSAVDHSHVSMTLLLCRLTNRTYPLAESCRRKCRVVEPLSAFCTSCTPSVALGRSRTLPLSTDLIL